MQSNLFLNTFKGLQLRVKKTFANPYLKAGISTFNLKIIKNQVDNSLHISSFLDGKIAYYNSFEFLHGVKEIFIDEVYKITLPENPVIIDCGSHIGLSVIYFKKLFPSAFIIAFEPDEKNFGLLAKNIQAFNLENIVLKNEAVWISNTKLAFSGEGNMGSKINASSSEKEHTTIVNAIRLKDILTGKIDFLKIDIEGAEYKVIRDIKDQLHLINNMFLEYHGSFEENIQLNELLEIIVSSGFKYYIKEAASVYPSPFFRGEINNQYDIQLNIFCFRI